MSLLIKEVRQVWGGDWTRKKIEILVEYAQAYLTIMNKHPYWKLLYFDGFAGSGLIGNKTQSENNLTFGAARRILEIYEPRSFDYYYLVEKNLENAKSLSLLTKQIYPDKYIPIITEDCNIKLRDLAAFLITPKGKNFRVLAYLDPYGMQLKWDSLKVLAGTKTDIWILVPTGMGVNRLLTRKGDISKSWIVRLETFLGMNEHEIRDYFYSENINVTLFGEEKYITKEENAIEKSAHLYKGRLKTLFKYVTDPFILRNTKGNILYHMFMSSNNAAGIRIANDIIVKYNEKAE